MRSAVYAILAPLVLAPVVVAACSDDSEPSAATSPTATADGSVTGSPDGSPSVGPNDGGGGVPEPACAALAGEPTWERLDPKLDWAKPADAGPLAPFVNGAAGLAYGNGVFVLLAATANHDKMHWATSTDGKAWTPHEQALTQAGAFTNGTPIHFTGKRFVFFAGHTGAGTFAYSSADGATWEGHLVKDGNANVGAFASNGDGLTVAGGGSGSFWTSADLSTWTNHADGNTSYLNVAASNGRFVATSNGAGTVYGSANGSDWSPLTITGTPVGGYSNLSAGRGIFVLSAGGSYQTSTDGVSFAATARTGPSDLGTKTNSGITFVGNRFVIFSVDFFNGKSTLAASSDAKEWVNFGKEETALTGTTAAPMAIAFGQCRYVALAGTSKDGLTKDFFLVGAAASPAP